MAVLLLVAVVAGMLALVCAEAPRQTATLWFAAIAVVPYWVYVPVGSGFSTAVVDLLALVVIAAVALNRARFRFPRPAIPMLMFAALAIVGGLIGGMPNWYARTVVLSWALPFYLGQVVVARFGVDWLTTVLRRLGLVVAGAAIVEFLTRWHPFVDLAPGSPVAFWAEIQSRGDLDRSELAFGHSIALGGAIALLTPFVVGSAPVGRRLAYTLLMVAAAATTLSRGALLATAAALLLMVLFRTDTRRGRRAQAAALIVVVLIAVPLLSPVFRDAGVELQQSAAVRGSFLSDLSGQTVLLGTSPSVSFNELLQPLFDGYRSIDNAYLLIALQSGVLALVAFAWLLVAPIKNVIRRRGSYADVAVVASIPLLATVALLTQWQSLFFCLLGAAYAWAELRPGPAASEAPALQGTGSADGVRGGRPPLEA